MVNQDIVRYLTQGTDRGFTLDFLKQNLIKNGFNELEVEEAARNVLLNKNSISTPTQIDQSWFVKHKVLTIIITLVLIGLLAGTILTLTKTKNNGIRIIIDKKVDSDNNQKINKNISMINCDGSKNLLIIEPGKKLSFLQITNTDEKQLSDLNNNNLIATSNTLNIPSANATQLTESYYLVSNPSLDNGTDMSQISSSNTQFLTISGIEGIENQTDPMGKMMKKWTERINGTENNFGYNTLYVNQENKSIEIAYTCKAE